MKVSEAVRARIVELCNEKNLSLYALSKEAGMTQSTLNDIMRRTTVNPGVVTIRKICTGFGIGVREFYDSPLFDELEVELD
ncbi:helix-turn-helix transcriptional regulator [Eubacteriales bacterium OttesenSCG-928-N14]|nr:helix-turn-helix transcriptional regulator [Eubacteriales bacterium OttesenSCG-928-N14]